MVRVKYTEIPKTIENSILYNARRGKKLDQPKQVWTNPDGKEFNSRKDAIEYQEKLDKELKKDDG